MGRRPEVVSVKRVVRGEGQKEPRRVKEEDVDDKEEKG